MLRCVGLRINFLDVTIMSKRSSVEQERVALTKLVTSHSLYLLLDINVVAAMVQHIQLSSKSQIHPSRNFDRLSKTFRCRDLDSTWATMKASQVAHREFGH